MKYLSVPIPERLYLKLAKFLEVSGIGLEPTSAIERAITDWMEDQTSNVGLSFGTERTDGHKGYLWKSLFLPNGTTVRMNYKDSMYYAKVIEDHLMHEGKAFSPSEFVKEITKTGRNAWRDLWIKRPTDDEYILAEALRNRRS